MSRIKRAWLALLFALPVGAFAIGVITLNVIDQLNPCVTWAPNSTYSRSSHDSCREHTIRGDSRIQAATTMVVLPGVILVAAVLGIWAAARSWRRMMLIAACLMLFETIPLLIELWPAPLALLAESGYISGVSDVGRRAPSAVIAGGAGNTTDQAVTSQHPNRRKPRCFPSAGWGDASPLSGEPPFSGRLLDGSGRSGCGEHPRHPRRLRLESLR